MSHGQRNDAAASASHSGSTGSAPSQHRHAIPDRDTALALAEAHAGTFSQCAHDLRGAIGLLAGAFDEVDAVCEVPDDVAAFVHRGRRRVEHLARRWSLVADVLRRDLDGNSTLARIDLADLAASAAEQAERVGRVRVLRSGETCLLRADPELATFAVAELMVAAGRTLGRRLRLDAQLEEQGRCILRLGPDQEEVITPMDDPTPPDPMMPGSAVAAPAWPPLTGHPELEGLPGRAGLWLATSLFRLQGVEATVSPTAPEVVRLSWPRG